MSALTFDMEKHSEIQHLKLTLDIRKSLNIPLPFPPSIHLFRICVGRV